MKYFSKFLFIVIYISLVSCNRNKGDISKKIKKNSQENQKTIEQEELIQDEPILFQTYNENENNEVLYSDTDLGTINTDSSLEAIFLPLDEGEYFQLRYIGYNRNTSEIPTNIVEKVSNGIVKDYYDTRTGWGTCQLSKDKRKVIIKRNGNHDIYLLDGNNGTLKFKGTVNKTCCGSNNLDYLITSNWYERKLCPSVLNLENFEEEFHVIWENQNEKISYYNFLSCSEDDINYLLQDLNKNGIEISIPDDEFDCIIYGFGDDGPTVYGFAFFKISTRELVEYNITFES